MAESPRLVMVAGPNGSGKSTLLAALRASPQVDLRSLYINADDLQRERGLTDARQAQQLANDLRGRALAARQDVMYETVMSHPSKIAELQQASAAGYHIIVHLVATRDPGINVARVALRVAAGGHDVPEDRTRERYGRTLALAPIALGYADQGVIFDNSERGATGRGLQAQAALQGGQVILTTDSPEPWVRRLADLVNERAAEIQAFADGAQSSGLPPQLAHLDGGSTRGPMVVIGKHYALQFDEDTQVPVLHDRGLLGEKAANLTTRQTYRIVYHEGVAELETVPSQSRSR